MKGTLYIQLDEKGKRLEKPEPLKCRMIDLGKDGSAVAGVGQAIKSNFRVLKLIRARVEFISADGMMIVGIVESGHDPFPILRYQEWWFVPSIKGG